MTERRQDMTDSQADILAQIERFENFLKVDPENITLLASLGDLYHQEGQFESAENYFASALALSEADPSLMARLASVHLSQSQFEKATELLRLAMEKRPDVGEIHNNLGIALYFLDNFEEARFHFDQALRLGLNDAEIYRFLGYTCHQQGQTEEAYTCIKQACEMQPTPELKGYLSLLSMDLGKRDQAIQSAKEVLLDQPDNVDALVVVGTTAIENQNMQEASELIRRAISMEEKNPRLWLSLGLLELYEGNHSAAIVALEKSLRFASRNAGIWVTLGWAYFANMDLDRSESTFRRAVEISPAFSEAHGGLAAVLAMRGESEQARQSIKRARRLDRTSFGAVFAISLLMQAAGKENQAGEILGRMFLQRPREGGMRLIDAIQKHAITRSTNIVPGLKSQDPDK